MIATVKQEGGLFLSSVQLNAHAHAHAHTHTHTRTRTHTHLYSLKSLAVC